MSRLVLRFLSCYDGDMTDTDDTPDVFNILTGDHPEEAVGVLGHYSDPDFYGKCMDLLLVLDPEATETFPSDEDFAAASPTVQYFTREQLIELLDATVGSINPDFGFNAGRTWGDIGIRANASI